MRNPCATAAALGALVLPPGVEPLGGDEGVRALDGQRPPGVFDLGQTRDVGDELSSELVYDD